MTAVFTEYTFTFELHEEAKFRRILERLEPEEFRVTKDIAQTEDARGNKMMETVMEMDPEAALTFRLGMKELKIRRKRTEEELAAEQELHDKNTIKVTVLVPPTP